MLTYHVYVHLSLRADVSHNVHLSMSHTRMPFWAQACGLTLGLGLKRATSRLRCQLLNTVTCELVRPSPSARACAMGERKRARRGSIASLPPSLQYQDVCHLFARNECHRKLCLHLLWKPLPAFLWYGGVDMQLTVVRVLATACMISGGQCAEASDTTNNHRLRRCELVQLLAPLFCDLGNLTSDFMDGWSYRGKMETRLLLPPTDSPNLSGERFDAERT